MSFQRLRRVLVAAACASSALLAACGGGDVVSQLHPSRVVAFGDGFGDLGQGGSRYTVNDGTVNNWSARVAADYGVTASAAAAGGTSYATGNARVSSHPDAAGNTSTPTVKEQIDTFLASQTLGANDLVIVSAGIGDILAEAGPTASRPRDQVLANVSLAAKSLGAQLRRLTQAGAQHVVVVGPYNLGRSPWAIATGQATLVTEASSKFNEDLLVSIVDLGQSVLYVDAGLYFNLVTASPTSYGLTDATTVVCTSVDAGAGIGTGSGQVNSALCTAATVRSGLDVTKYLFADQIYFTPVAHRLFGDYAYDRIRSRW